MAKMTLEAARVNRHLTQDELGKELGVSRQTIRKWEKGKTKIKTTNLYALCRVLEIKEDDIILPM